MKINNKRNQRRIRVRDRIKEILTIESIRMQRFFWDTNTRREKVARLRLELAALERRIIQ